MLGGWWWSPERASCSAPVRLSRVPLTPGLGREGVRTGGVGGDLGCDTKSHAVSELVEEGWLMPGT